MRQIGLPPALVHPAEIDESVLKGELPAAHARRLASAKLAAVAPDHSDVYVLAADTVVACGRRILPKAEDAATARACLELLSGRRHRVLGAIEVRAPDGSILRVLKATLVLPIVAGPISRALVVAAVCSDPLTSVVGTATTPFAPSSK